MKRSILVLLVFAAAPLLAQQPPEIRFHSVPDFLKLPSDIYLGEATGVAVNSKGHVFVFSRGNTTGPASVHYATTDGTATDAVDYTSATGTLNFAAGETAKWVDVSLLDNLESAGDRTFSLALSSPGGSASVAGGLSEEGGPRRTSPRSRPATRLTARRTAL